MSFVPSLLQAIVRVDGEALVMHAGDKPYVVSPTGQVELANRGLTLEAVNGVVNQLLPVELQQALQEFGAVQYELPAMPEFPGEHFTVVAARGGDDLWTEIRRRRVPDDDSVPEEFFGTSSAPAVAQAQAQVAVPQAVIPQPAVVAPPSPPQSVISQPAAPPPPPAWQVTPLPPVEPPPMPIDSLDEVPGAHVADDDLHLPNAAQLWPERPEPEDDSDSEEGEEIEIDLDAEVEVEEEEPEPPPTWQPAFAPLPVAPPAPVAEVLTTPLVAAPAARATAAPPPPPVISQPAAPPSPVPPPAWHVTPLPAVAPPLLTDSLDEIPGDHLAGDDLRLLSEAQLRLERPEPEDDGESEEQGEEIQIDLDADVEEEEPEPPPAWQPADAPPPVAPLHVAPPAPVAEVRTTPPVAAPAASATAAPPLNMPTPEVAATAPPVVTEQPPAVRAPMQRIFRAMQRHSLTASAAPPPDVPTPEVAATAPPVVTEPPPPVQTLAASAAPPLDEPTYEVAAAAPPVVTGQPLPVQGSTASAPPPVDVPTREVAAAASSLVIDQSPAVQALTAFAAPPRSAHGVPPPAAPPSAAAQKEPLASQRSGPPSQPGVVLPISRNPVRSEQPPPMVPDPTLSGLERLLRVSAARGASTLYLSSGSRPSVRVDGELQMLDAEPVHVARDVESLLLTLMPERSHEALRTGAATEWIVDIEGVGRVRCMSFRDHLGPGGVFRLMPTRSISADQLGLPRQVQSLAIEPEGLVLVAGPRSSGKRTLMAAFVDLMNRTRRDHIITIEREINIVHERGQSFISQREVRGNDDEMLAAARGALREDPDVMVIEDLRTGPLMNVALEAAASGRLVVGGFSAHTATGAIDRIIDLYAPEYRMQVQLALADSLRGVIVQTLLRKIGGGRLPAREVLLNTPAVSSVIAEGKTSQLPMAIEGGRRYGMMPLNDTLVGLVQNGSVEAREAYRRSPDRPGFLAALNRQGLDTSFVERLA